MKIRKILTTGIISGLSMGVFLFIAGAVFSRIIYGPQFAPPGKFEPEQLNAWYFIWTKLLIGIFFGLLFTLTYEGLPLKTRLRTGFDGLKYGFVFWLVISLWDISHPLVYGSVNNKDQVFWNKDQVFWLVYSLFGFLACGYTLGLIYKRRANKNEELKTNQGDQ